MMSPNPETLEVPGARLRALVVEDEWPIRNYLVELIESTQLAEVVGAVATLEEARGALQHSAESTVDVAFVDVRLEGDRDGRSGLDLIRSIATSPGAPMFVVATAFEEHAIEAFDLGVVDYLLKPFSRQRVRRCLQRLVERRPMTSPALKKRMVARKRTSLVFLDPAEIWAFEAADRLTFVHSSQGKFDVDLSLATIEGSFGRSFLRVHRNWLINLAHVRELDRVDGQTTLFVGFGIGDERGGVRVPVARERAPSLRRMLVNAADGPQHDLQPKI